MKDNDGNVFSFFSGVLIAVIFCGFINVISESACAPTPAMLKERYERSLANEKKRHEQAIGGFKQ